MPLAEILVVDDDQSVLATVQAVLEMDGYHVSAAGSGAAAMREIREREFDLVLTDLRLDDLDGVAILEEIRRRSPETVTVLLTGYASLESAVKALRQGAYDYLFKPCEVEELRATVARGIEKRQLTLALRERVSELEAANRTNQSLNEDLLERVKSATSALIARMRELARARDEISTLYRDAQRHVSKLEELDQLKSQFLSMASHELKTPLTAMSGFVQLALRRARRRLQIGAPTPAEWEPEQHTMLHQLESLNRQTSKLARLVDELLDVSRIESGRVEFHFVPIDFGEMIVEAVGRMQMTTTNHSLSVDLPAKDRGILVGDRDHLEQVLNNLLSNAIKYSPEGGSVDVSLRPDGEGVLLTVRDQGVGIPPAELQAIFDLFYRAREGRGHYSGGMGLGLYISREIVKRHGGEIWAESQPGSGSTFHVRLPRAPVTNGAVPSGLESGLPLGPGPDDVRQEVPEHRHADAH